MAGDWIKVRVNLRKTPQVKGIAVRLNLTPRDVVGRLVDVWGIGDAYAIARESLSRFCPGEGGTNVPDIEGFLSHYTFADLDEEAGQTGFANAMHLEGWLDLYDGGLAFPEWDQHHSKSAKERACEQKKKRNQRRSEKKCPGASGTNVPHEQGLEKRREDSNTPIVPKGTESAADAFARLMERWNKIDGVTHCREATAKRLRSLKARMAKDGWSEKVVPALELVAKSTFCKGGGDRKWVADIDWFLRPDTVTRILEGKYQSQNGSAESDNYEDIVA